jgi:hypothetical protein
MVEEIEDPQFYIKIIDGKEVITPNPSHPMYERIRERVKRGKNGL